MKIRTRLAIAALSTLAIAGFSVAQAAAADPDIKGYVSSKRMDLFGYYMPKGNPKFGKYALSNISLGGLDEFTAYEKGKKDPPEYAPFMIEFNDVTSAKKTNEMGQPYYTRSARVLPSAYWIFGNAVMFRGHDKQLGDVVFTGHLESNALTKAKAKGDSQDTVLNGDLTVGKTTIKNLNFFWFGGD